MMVRSFPSMRSALLILALALPASAIAQTYALSPEEKERVLAAGTEATAEAARAGPVAGAPGAAIHGEIGGAIGTGGMRGLYGTAAIPLGENAGAVVSFEQSRWGDRRR